MTPQPTTPVRLGGVPAAGAAGRALDDWCPSRRQVMRGLVAIGGVTLVPGLLTACSADDGGGGAGGNGGAADTGTGDGGDSGVAGATVPAADIAVGTAVVVQVGDANYVVAQPEEGQFVAFDATCTHQGTTVGADAGGLTLTCPNHGSRFDAAAGAAVINGPATQPLAPVDVTLDGDQLVLG